MRSVRRRGSWRERARLVGPCLVAALWAAPLASASEFGPAASSRLRAGSTETVRLDAALPGVDERELVLSVDGGKTFPVRLTRGIEPDERTAAWRVPVLPTEHAVLALREGEGGAEEEIVATSAEFAILSTAASPVEEIHFRNGEWKTREADSSAPEPPAPSLWKGGHGRISPLEASSAPCEEPARGLPADPDSAAAPEKTTARSSSSRGRSPHPSVTPFLPLRE